MPSEKLKPWYSFVSGNDYTGKDECFFNLPNELWVQNLENNSQIILEEINKLIAADDKNIIPYYNRTLANASLKWTIFPLHIWGIKQYKNCKKCPLTTQLIKSIPGMTSASFSILKANTSIKPHLGDSNVMYRCHLGLQIPRGCGIKVGEETKEWKTGKLLAFCDAKKHSAWNNSNEDRLVLIIDVLRAEFISEKKIICSKILSTLFWQLIFQKINIIPHLPAIFREWMMYGILPVAFLFSILLKFSGKLLYKD